VIFPKWKIQNNESKALAATQLRIISMLHENADKRYLDFNERYPPFLKESSTPDCRIFRVSHEF
jgi:hypothetical protein